MHPAFSVILFTCSAGVGYGLLAMLAIDSMGVVDARGFAVNPSFVSIIALGLITFGLLSSTFHLGHPERAWRALSQWQTSWLSREGVLAIACYAPSLSFLFLVWRDESASSTLAIVGSLMLILAAATVYATGMIYASLRAIPSWHSAWVPANYLSLGFASGAVLYHAFAALHGRAGIVLTIIGIGSLALALGFKKTYWRQIDAKHANADSASAIGVKPGSTFHLSQAPHSHENYLQQEMGFRIARKHAHKLRRFVLLSAFFAPIILLAIAAVLDDGLVSTALSCGASLLFLAGVVVERWLFFAEARHVMNNYYNPMQEVA